MIRNIFKKTNKNSKFDEYIKKYNISAQFMSVNRKMVSRAMLVGFFVAFIPMPMQMVAVILMMPFVRFNVPIGLLMCWVTNPITMPFIYYIEYQMGSFLLSTQMMPVQMTIEWFSANIDNIFIPLYVGALFFSTTLSSLSYYLINHFWRSSVDKNKKLHFSDRK
jgi:uncharacterized protein (DUF2062 family)